MPGLIAWCVCIVAVCLRLAAPAAAQSAPAASAPAPDLSPAERAQRDTDKVFRWILIHSDKPRKPAPAAKDEKPAARAKPAARVPVAKADAPLAASAPAAIAPPAPARAQTARIEPAQTPLPQSTPSAIPAPGAPSEPAPLATAPPEALAEEALVPLSQLDPKLPTKLPRGARNGEVQVRFTVLPDGSVAEPKVASSSNPRLNAAALAAVAQWRFAPLRKAQSGSVALVFSVE